MDSSHSEPDGSCTGRFHRDARRDVVGQRDHVGPVFLRISRMPVPNILPDDFVFEPGKAITLRQGDDIALLANGILVSRALEAAELLHVRGIEARVLNMSSMAPVDRAAVVAAAKETRGIVTMEEASVYGGLGGAVAEIVADEHPTARQAAGSSWSLRSHRKRQSFFSSTLALLPEGIQSAALQLLQKVAAG